MDKKPYYLEPHIEAVLSYVPIVGAVFVLLMEKNNKFVRFHAIQSIIFWVVALGISAIVDFLKTLYIGLIISPLFQLTLFICTLYLMYTAYNKQEYELPIIGKVAKEQAYK